MKKIIVSVTIEETNENPTVRWLSRTKTDRFVVENIAETDDIPTICEETQVATYNMVEDLLKEFAHGSQ